MSATRSLQKEPQKMLPDVHVVDLDNGFRALLVERGPLPVVASVLWYGVGARDEHSGETGVSHFLEHMMFKGTKRFAKGEIDLLTSKMGGSNNAFTDNDSTAYYFSLAADRWETALEIDRLRFDSVWVCDHMYGVPNPSLPIFEAWSQLAAVGAITDHVQLGTLVTPPFFRNPGVLAKQVATIDHISNGRTIMGLGAGWFAPEFEGYGNPFPSLRDRMRALDETAQILKALWTAL